MSQRMRSHVPGRYSQLLNAPAYNLQQGSRLQGPKRRVQCNKDMTARATGPPVPQISEDCFSHFVLDRIVLKPTSLRSFYSKCFVAPVEIAQAKPRHFTAAKRIDRAQR